MSKPPVPDHPIADETLEPDAAKAALRKQAASQRSAAARDCPDAAVVLATWADALIENFGSGLFAAYLPIRSELDPLALVAALVARGQTTAMPITPEPGLPLTFHAWAPGDVLDEGPYGTQQPPLTAQIVTPDVILAPMLAFDRRCRRLGYGGGFYDRSIGALRNRGVAVKAIGIAFDGQLVDKVPVGPYDMALDAVLTPHGLRWPD